MKNDISLIEDDTILEKVIPTNNFKTKIKNESNKKDQKIILKLLKNLYEHFNDKSKLISDIKEINLFISTNQFDNLEKNYIQDFMKILVLFIIPVNFVIFHYEESSSKIKLTILYELKETSLELIGLFKKITKMKFEEDIKVLIKSNYLHNLNKLIFGKKDYLILHKVYECLIEKKNMLEISDFTRIAFSSVLFNIINSEYYGERKIIKHKWIEPQIPLLPKQESNKYTLVLDLDETLIHSFFTKNERYYLVRPGALDLLSILSEFYEIVIFTTGTQEYADNIIDQLDLTGNYVSYRLFRQHTSKKETQDHKDITKLGRSLARTIIVDNIRNNFALHPDNGLYIKTWKYDIEDLQLFGLTKLLLHIAKIGFYDVRDAIHIIANELKDRHIDNLVNPYDEIDLNKVIMIVKEMNHN